MLQKSANILSKRDHGVDQYEIVVEKLGGNIMAAFPHELTKELDATSVKNVFDMLGIPIPINMKNRKFYILMAK